MSNVSCFSISDISAKSLQAFRFKESKSFYNKVGRRDILNQQKYHSGHREFGLLIFRHVLNRSILSYLVRKKFRFAIVDKAGFLLSPQYLAGSSALIPIHISLPSGKLSHVIFSTSEASVYFICLVHEAALKLGFSHTNGFSLTSVIWY